jgi:hypothetical protein
VDRSSARLVEESRMADQMAWQVGGWGLQPVRLPYCSVRSKLSACCWRWRPGSGAGLAFCGACAACGHWAQPSVWLIGLAQPFLAVW